MKAPPTQRRLIEEAGSDPFDEPLAPPSLSAQSQMAKHLLQEHNEPDFQLARDVYLGGEQRRPSQILTWDPVSARFWCQRCEGIVFTTGEITDQMVVRVQRFDPDLRPHLAGLGTRAERDRMTRHYLSGGLNRERLRSLEAAGPRRRGAAGKRPGVEERKRRLQRWMLERYADLGVFQRILEEAEQMQRLDPDAWRSLAHCANLSQSTLARYWYDIPPQLRNQAAAAHEARHPG